MLEGKTPAVGATRAQNAAKTELDALADEAMQTKQRFPKKPRTVQKEHSALILNERSPA